MGAESVNPGSLYRRIFNSGTTGQAVWRAVRILRQIDKQLSIEQGKRSGRERQIGVHGNRILAHLVFQDLGIRVTEGDETAFESAVKDVPSLVESNYAKLVSVVNNGYASNYLASLFKNATRCADLVHDCRVLDWK